MKCPHCNKENPDHARYCLHCGAKHGVEPSRECLHCGGCIPDGAGYCPACGSPRSESPAGDQGVERPSPRADLLQRLAPKKYVEQLLASSGRIAGERRVVTILFVDIKGSTAMAESLDPEEVMEIMNAAFETMIAPIYRYEGTVARIMGDAVLAFFGAPIAHEDDPVRACRAALEIIGCARAYAEKLDHERGIGGFDVRVGINTGLVVVGEVGTDLRVEYTAMGDAVNLAKRMESAAEPGTVLISDNTQKLIAPLFETEDLGSIHVKGKTEPVAVFRLLSPKPERTPGSWPGDGEPQMIGREKELEQLVSAVDTLRHGGGGTYAVTGAPGLGKSRLVVEMRRSYTDDLTWAEGTCTSFTQNTSYWIVQDLLYGLLGVERGAEPADIQSIFQESLEVLDIGDSELSERIQAHLSLLLDLPSEAAPVMHEPEDMRPIIERTFCDYIRVWSRSKPIVLVWHDLHWIDSSSQELLEALVPLTNEVPLLLILVFRPGEKRIQDLHEWKVQASGEYYHAIELLPLDRDTGARLLDSLLEGRQLPKEIFDLILDHAEGNTFYMVEVVQSLRDAGLFDQDGAITARQIKELGIPTTLHGAIMAHVDRLSPQDKRILQTASVIGRVFEPVVLAETLDPRITGHVLDLFLFNLYQRGFIAQRITGEVPGEPGFGCNTPKDISLWRTMQIRLPQEQATLPHGRETPVRAECYFMTPALAEVTYNSLLKSQRTEIHRRAGEAMEAVHPDRQEELAPALAYHFEKGGVTDKAVHYLVRVARRAARIRANREAVTGYSKVIALVEKSTGEGTGTQLPSGIRPAELHEELGDVYYVMSEYGHAVEQYERAQERTGEKQMRARASRKKGQAFEKWGKYADARTCFETALTELGEIPDTTEAAYVYTGLGLVHYRLDELDRAVELGSRALEIMEESEHESGIAQACNNLAIMYGKRREWDKSIELHHRCMSIWERIGDAYGLAASHNNIGLALNGSGEWRQAIEHFEEGLALFERLGNKHGLARSYDNLGQVYAEQGQIEKATDCMKAAVTILSEISKDKAEMTPELWQSGAW